MEPASDSQEFQYSAWMPAYLFSDGVGNTLQVDAAFIRQIVEDVGGSNRFRPCNFKQLSAPLLINHSF